MQVLCRANEQVGILFVHDAEHLLEFCAVDDFTGELTGEGYSKHIRKVLAVKDLLFEHQLRKRLGLDELCCVLAE